MYRKINVTAAEMMELRNEGYCNADIACLLDISPATVSKYIGKQGKRMERLEAFSGRGRKNGDAEEEICETKKQMTKPKYVPSKETYRIGGAGDLSVCIERDADIIEIRNRDGAIRLYFDEAAALVEFLAWAGREKCQTEVEDGER